MNDQHQVKCNRTGGILKRTKASKLFWVDEVAETRSSIIPVQIRMFSVLLVRFGRELFELNNNMEDIHHMYKVLDLMVMGSHLLMAAVIMVLPIRFHTTILHPLMKDPTTIHLLPHITVPMSNTRHQVQDILPKM